MAQHKHALPIACVEGWSTTQRWTGVRLRDLAALAGAPAGAVLRVESLQQRGVLRRATLGHAQHCDERALLALRVNGADLSLDHGYPARVIVPALPGVHCTKWVSRVTLRLIARQATAPPRCTCSGTVALAACLRAQPLARSALPRGLNVLVWLVGGAMLHDLVLVPLYSPLDGRAASRARVTARGPASTTSACPRRSRACCCSSTSR